MAEYSAVRASAKAASKDLAHLRSFLKKRAEQRRTHSTGEEKRPSMEVSAQGS